MKFLLCPDEQFREEFDGVANGLIANGNEAFGFNSDIFKAHEERESDYFIFSPNNIKAPEIQQFLKAKSPNYLVINSEQILSFNGNSLNLPSFASTIKYKTQLPSKNLECDIAIFSDGFHADVVHSLYAKLYKNYRIKIIGTFINCPGYIGVGNIADIIKLGKSAKLSICTNKILANSLLYNEIFATCNHPNPESLLSLNEDEIEALVIQSKNDITTDIKLGKAICEKFSNSN